MQAHAVLSRIAHLSLEHGHARIALASVAVMGAVAVLLAIPRPARTLPLRPAIWAVPGTLALWVVVWVAYRPLPNQIPVVGYLWVWLALCIAGSAATLVRRSPASRRVAVTTVAGLLGTAAAVGQVNAQTGMYPTVGSLLGHRPTATVAAVTFDTVPGWQPRVQSGTPVDSAWRPPIRMPAAGVVTEATIPGTESGFTARPAVLYLPPAYLTSPRPILPVMVMIAGQPGAPQDWFTGGRMATTLDAYAARHHGLAPVVVVVDALGSRDANPLCLDSALGNDATYLARDVPAWITRTLQVSTDPGHWAIGGFSYGGTCSIQLAVNYPGVYPNFLDFLGQDEPSLGDHASTVAAAYAGNEAAFAAVNPMDVLRRRPFPQLTGVFVAGAADDEYRPQQQRIFAAARAAGASVRYYDLPGGHEGATWAAALECEIDWTGSQLGLTN